MSQPLSIKTGKTSILTLDSGTGGSAIMRISRPGSGRVAWVVERHRLLSTADMLGSERHVLSFYSRASLEVRNDRWGTTITVTNRSTGLSKLARLSKDEAELAADWLRSRAADRDR